MIRRLLVGGTTVLLLAATVYLVVESNRLAHTAARPAAAGGTAAGGTAAGGTAAGGTAGSPVPPAAARPGSWVMAENLRPGTTGWRLARRGRPDQIEGYADRTSARQGDVVRLYVSTRAPRFAVEAYRMGYYQGLDGRLVWRSAPQPGLVQPAPVRTPTTNMVEARWTPSAEVPIGTDWPPGDYLLKLVDSQGFGRYVPLTVRDDTSTAALVVMNAVTTWQAYNLWGGYNLYAGASGSFAERSRVASFDRPYGQDGAGDFFGNEQPLVSFVEQLGLDVTYITDVDLHERPGLLLRHRALVSLGHDEYWSTAMRRGAEQARDHGVNIAFLGANADFRHIRFERSPLGPDRREVNYKRPAHADPLYGVDDAEVTVDWRNPPLDQPESTLNGDLYECNPVRADAVVADLSSWILAGTGLRAGDRLPSLVGPEYDRVQPGFPTPATIEVLFHSRVRCNGMRSYADVTYYTAPSGAGVFDSGTSAWVCQLDRSCSQRRAKDPRNRRAVRRMTENLLRAFAAGPAGLAHPSRPNLRVLGIG